MKRRARVVRSALFVVVLLVIGALMLPTQVWFDQRHEIDQANAQLSELQRANTELEQKVARMGSKSSIERQARVDFGYVKPGEESYNITAAPPPVVQLPDVWPFNRLQPTLSRLATQR